MPGLSVVSISRRLAAFAHDHCLSRTFPVSLFMTHSCAVCDPREPAIEPAKVWWLCRLRREECALTLKSEARSLFSQVKHPLVFTSGAKLRGTERPVPSVQHHVPISRVKTTASVQGQPVCINAAYANTELAYAEPVQQCRTNATTTSVTVQRRASVRRQRQWHSAEAV